MWRPGSGHASGLHLTRKVLESFCIGAVANKVQVTEIGIHREDIATFLLRIRVGKAKLLPGSLDGDRGAVDQGGRLRMGDDPDVGRVREELGALLLELLKGHGHGEPPEG